MTTSLDHRLNQILARMTGPEFLRSGGIGNEIACYIFDYSPTDELRVRQHVRWMMDRLASHHSGLRALHLDLFEVVIDYLAGRNLLDKTLKMQARKGDAAVLKALRGPLASEKLRDAIQAAYDPSSYELVLISGVGSVWPMIRVHGLLNSLHTVMANTPLVLFYPGSFDGTTLKLFGHIAPGATSPDARHYYRAFRLIPRETRP